MKKYIVLGSVFAALVSPTMSFADSVQYSGHECVAQAKTSQRLIYDSDAFRITGPSSKLIRCAGSTQTHASAVFTTSKMESFGHYVRAKEISSARLCVIRKHYEGVPGNSSPSFVCGATDRDGGSTFTYDLRLPTGAFFSRFDQPVVSMFALSRHNPNIRSYGFRYQSPPPPPQE